MEGQAIQMPPNQRQVIERFVAACQADERVVAALLVGSYANGAADVHSDLDLYVLTSDEAYEVFSAGREAFICQWGEPAFLEDFDLEDIVFCIFPDGTEVELNFGRESQSNDILDGAYSVLLDKKGRLAGVAPSRLKPDQAEQIETLRRQIYWFWHEMSHFITAMGRGHLWWASGQLESLRHYCLNLARLRQDFSDTGVGAESYFKIEKTLPAEQLAPLQATFCPLEAEAMLQAAGVILHFYRELAAPLARTYAIPYPADLDRVMSERLGHLTSVLSK